MKRKYLLGIIQLDTQNDKGRNLEKICSFIDEAAARGAKIVALPEVMNLIGDNVGAGGGAETIPGYSTEILAAKAMEHGIYVHCGSLREEIPGDARASPTTVMLDPQGQVIATYRKLHTFDVTLPDGTIANESARIRPGKDIVTVDSELGRLGFSICYDIRFPELYRLLALQGARIIFAPANFTMPTGKEIGIHTHNNLPLAFANTIEAIVLGANYVDASIGGLGRGAGNCPMELALSFLHNPKFQMRPILDALQNHVEPRREALRWGFAIPYMLTGYLNQHPKAAMAFMEGDNFRDIVKFYDQSLDA